MTFSIALTMFRAKHNITQEQAAKILGVSPNMIYRYEKGLVNPTRKNKIVFENIMQNYNKNND